MVPTLCLAAWLTVESDLTDAVLQGVQGERQRQYTAVEHLVQEFGRLQVLLLLGKVPCPGPLGR